MIDSLTIALSGLKANKDRANVAAENIANVSTAGSIPNAAVDRPKDVYIPKRVTQTTATTYNPDCTTNGAGVRTSVEPTDPGYQVAQDPDAYYADENGLVAVPDVNLETEIINLKLASTLFKANIKVIESTQDMTDSLLDIEA